MSFDVTTQTISIVRGDDRVIVFTIPAGCPDGLTVMDVVSGTFTARDREEQIILASELVEAVDATTVRVTLTHGHTDAPVGQYKADLELRFPGGPDGGPDDPYAGLLVWTPWVGRLSLGQDQTREP